MNLLRGALLTLLVAGPVSAYAEANKCGHQCEVCKDHCQCEKCDCKDNCKCEKK